MKMALKRCRRLSESERMTKKKRVDYFAFLPDDLLLEILSKIPADLLRYKVKYVCTRWLNLITNRILLDQGSLILQKPNGDYPARLVDINEGRLGLKSKEQFLDIPYRGRIKSWCNELLLITDPNKHGSLYIFNLITREGSFLPQCSSNCRGHYGCQCGLGLAFDEFKGVYKVVHVFVGPPIQCEILVLKNDIASCNNWSKWKKINGPSYTGQRQYYWDDPVSVQGRYFHWDVHSSKYLVSMDIVKERFRQTRLPGSADYPMSSQYYFVEMGGYLALLHKVSSVQVDIWVLRDFQRTTWEKLQCINISSYVGSKIYPGSVLPVPVTSLRHKSHLIFRKSGTEIGLFSYNLKTKLMEKLDIQIAGDERCVVHSTAPGFR